MTSNPTDPKIEEELTQAFLSQYYDGRDEARDAVTPDLGMGLEQWGKISGIESRISPLGDTPLCLLEGCSTPGNGRALKAFLSQFGIKSPRIQAVDLINIDQFYAQKGFALPDIEFFQGDASDLASLYTNSSVDLIVQDGLLNCAPFVNHEPIMREAHRILKPEGVMLSGVTDELCVQRHKKLSEAELSKKYDAMVNINATSLLNLFWRKQYK